MSEQPKQQSLEEMAAIGQAALRASGSAHRASLKADVYSMRHEPGLNKMLALAKEMRAKALFDLSSGTKENFDRNQATYLAWEDIVSIIELGPREVKTGQPTKGIGATNT